jgi:hypothetical protein
LMRCRWRGRNVLPTIVVNNRYGKDTICKVESSQISIWRISNCGRPNIKLLHWSPYL